MALAVSSRSPRNHGDLKTERLQCGDRLLRRCAWHVGEGDDAQDTIHLGNVNNRIPCLRKRMGFCFPIVYGEMVPLHETYRTRKVGLAVYVSLNSFSGESLKCFDGERCESSPFPFPHNGTS